MIDKNQIETILKTNGIHPTAPDEVIRSVLISARWNDNDVDTALMVLKENTTTNTSRVDTLHRVFHTDDKLTPADISAMLGVKVSIDATDLKDLQAERKKVERAQTLAAVILAFSIVLFGLTYLLYVEEAGVFHPSEKNAPVPTAR